MRLIMTLLVRDEEDILDWNLRYHLARGVDHFVVTDNLSVDGTTSILRGYERRGVLSYIHEPTDDYSQDLWVTRMARVAADELEADWILHSDADEFWWPGGGKDLKTLFRDVPAEVEAVQVDRANFVGPLHEPQSSFHERMVYRQRRSTNSLGKPLPPKIAHRPLERPFVHQGNHKVSNRDVLLESQPIDDLVIFHFPARTPAQLRNKIEKGGAAYERNRRLGEGVGQTWRKMYEYLRTGRFDEVLKNSFLDDDGVSFASVLEDGRLRDYLKGI